MSGWLNNLLTREIRHSDNHGGEEAGFDLI
jgi:hypothetical protein